MCRHIAQPVDAAGFHGGVGGEAFGDGLCDDGLSLLGQPLQQRLLLGNQPINLCRLLIQKRRDAHLGVEGWRGISISTS